MAKKVFHGGKWRLLKDDGSGLASAGIFDKGCDPPVEGNDEVWEADGVEWRRKPTAAELAKKAEEKAGLDAEQAQAEVERLRLASEPPPLGSREYLVVSQRDEWFMGRFSPDRLEERLNTLARDGWRVIAATTSDVGTWFGSFAGGARQEMVILMERIVGEGFRLPTGKERPVTRDMSVP